MNSAAGEGFGCALLADSELLFADLHDAELRQNRCFLYHVLGGDWCVPVGGMGAVSEALAEPSSVIGKP